MSWERRVFDLFDDLEQQAGGLAFTERDAVVAELARAEYAEVELGSRFHASLGRAVQLHVRGLGTLHGRLERVGAGWCLVVGDPAGRAVTVVRLAALLSVRGLSPRAVPEPVRGPLSRLGVGSVMRGLAEQAEPVHLVLLDGQSRRGVLGRVGADFVEVTTGQGDPEVVPFDAVAAARPS